MTPDLATLVLLALAALAVALTGGVLALLARRIHPGLRLVRLWAWYTALIALLVAAVFALVLY